jgi:adenylate cyclase
LGSERREMTVMFIDLQGYTSISENLPPHDLIRMLNMFLGQMSDAIADNKGVINDFLGDAVMAYWGPPFTSHDEQALLGCKAALDAVDNFEKFWSDVIAELGDKAVGLELNMRVGISSGDMVAGNIGSVASRKYSVILDPVNLGARLEGANKNYGTRIMMSQRTRDLAGPEIHVRELDLIRVKGKREPTRVFELLSSKTATDGFHTGLEAYRKQDWESAERAFKSCLSIAPNDPVPNVFLDQITHFKAQPPGSEWAGVWKFQTK